MSETISNGLTITIPSLGDSNWSSSIKTNCFEPISGHDHTGSGNGVQIATGAIANLAVTTGKIALQAVGEAQLGDNSVTRDKIFNLEVTTGKLAAGAVTADKILDGTITLDKLYDQAGGTVIGRNIGSGVPSAIQVTSAMLDADAASRSTLLLQSILTAIIEGAFAATPMYLPGMSGGLTAYEIRVPKACKVTHISTAATRPLASGSYTVHIYKNGVSAATYTYNVDGEAGAISSTVTYAAQDTLGVYLQGIDGNWFGDTVADMFIHTWGHFTE